MPDKRQQSKQRRAARNRATREALAARRDAAARAASSSPASEPAEPDGRRAGRRPGAAAPPTPAQPRTLGDMLQGTRPGDRAVLLSVVFAVAGAVALLFYRVPVDDRGEALPVRFRAVAAMVRERLTGEPVPDDSSTLLDVSGPSILLMIGLPVLVTLFAVWGNRRPDRARMLTFAMLALAGTVILTGGLGLFYFPAMIVLAIGGFRARRADLPAATAERLARTGRSRRDGDVIDVDGEEVSGEDDPLADLEAELRAEEEAERDADAGEADEADEVGDDAEPEESGRRRRRR
ncbi:MAG TPA: hypothetical protein VFZ77_11280 [Acidimicrobiales bacterium]